MEVQILGSGCPKCKLLEEKAREAVSLMAIEAEVVKITEMDEILDMGVMMTPALAIDGEVKTTGKVLSVEQIQKILKESV
ncbi:MAG: TM0996/MTH895 family glutaredoxin-like protein [Spirochaetaceae bacterium]|nr:TM0996/MTH895 family glutaredoxin-like protein [Spirochaetaceae bacterium]